jgi:hypothetical protein
VRVQKILQASKAAVGLAEESGYNLVAPLGYSTGDWYVDAHEGDEAKLRARGSSRGPVIETGLKPIYQLRQEHPEIAGDPDRRQSGTELP